MLIAAVAMFDTRAGALPDPSGTAPGGLGPGFYPFWAAALIFVTGGAVAYRALVSALPREGVFKDRRSIAAVVTLIVPVIVATSSLAWTGFYAMTAAYMGFFMLSVGRYRRYWAGAAAVLLPAAIYAAFELGFRVPLPKSLLYPAVPF